PAAPIPTVTRRAGSPGRRSVDQSEADAEGETEHARWVQALATLEPSNQLIVSTGSAAVLEVARPRVVLRRVAPRHSVSSSRQAPDSSALVDASLAKNWAAGASTPEARHNAVETWGSSFPSGPSPGRKP
ncbi:hypothetical protein JXA88_19070, partial [Candidatus Fermentibacteria bacterium]|nr:hypothetical protein [Candidatus Fermentibacteria bacterium]